MRDLYQRLDIPEDATEAEARRALSTADGELRASAEAVLLDPRRRSVYDRNRNLLITIGKLRSHLGLNLTPFWARGEFSDFTVGAPTQVAKKADASLIATAFGPTKRSSRRRRSRRTEILAAIAGGVISLAILIALIFATRGSAAAALSGP